MRPEVIMIHPAIILLGSPDQAEIRSLLQYLPRSQYLLLDDSWLCRENVIEWHLDNQGQTTLKLGDYQIDPGHLRSVFHRPLEYQIEGSRLVSVLLRPHPLVAPNDMLFAQGEAESTLLGALNCFDCLWVNHPLCDRFADYKLHQLALARHLGLRVPDTLVSSDREALRSFWHQHQGKVITKAITAYPSKLLNNEVPITRMVTADDLDLLDVAVPGPILFQEFIPAQLDLRITIIGDEVFAAAIHSQEGKGALDWRLDYTVRFTSYALEEPVAEALKKVASALGLAYGAADLRLTPEGELVFLEINAQGAYLFVEKLTGQPLTRTLAELLQFGKMSRPTICHGSLRQT
jgi:glutathione synthase/RimK-type ligase-like ATP-grasp enzyme